MTPFHNMALMSSSHVAADVDRHTEVFADAAERIPAESAGGPGTGAALLPDRPTALVTGAGSPDGIGFATARLLGRMGASVAVTSTTERIHERVAELRREGITALGSSPTSPHRSTWPRWRPPSWIGARPSTSSSTTPAWSPR